MTERTIRIGNLTRHRVSRGSPLMVPLRVHMLSIDYQNYLTATATANHSHSHSNSLPLLLLLLAQPLLLPHPPNQLQLLLVWEPCTLPHTRQSPPAPTLVLHAAAAPPCRLLLLPMLLLLLLQALAGSTLGAWLTLGTCQPPRPP